ncbi:hypothetical protein [Fischerella sp. PCC 9605]|uniref:hypothetical protein n=1 Tax=Fischerella sp. PCC 9605 TaxID=1173024 RepID=UPI00047D3060|nr:hypothetical protein [Fischerella sp. PCC 9605]
MIKKLFISRREKSFGEWCSGALKGDFSKTQETLNIPSVTALSVASTVLLSTVAMCITEQGVEAQIKYGRQKLDGDS